MRDASVTSQTCHLSPATVGPLKPKIKVTVIKEEDTVRMENGLLAKQKSSHEKKFAAITLMIIATASSMRFVPEPAPRDKKGPAILDQKIQTIPSR
jgi:hypothetical protein